MKVTYYAAVFALAGLFYGICPATAIQLLDVLLLSDGTSVTGVIMEEEPGKSFVLETEDGELLRYGFRDIERVEKKLVEEEALIENRDVVYLKDGVVFRGMIVGRVPDKEITLELENGQLLDFNMNEVFKIAKEQVATGVVKKVVLKPKKAEKDRVEIQIQIAMNQLEFKQDRQKQGGEASEVQSLRDEVDRLKEEIEQLEEQQEEVETAAAEEDERFAEIESELGDFRVELLGAAEELEQRIAACESPQIKERLAAKYGDLQRNIAEILQRAEVIALVAQPDPRVEQIEMQEKATEALAIVQNRLWEKPGYEEQWETLVAELPFEERQSIFREVRRTDQIGSAVVNLIPFAYLGSWRQKDYFGATLGMGVNLGVLIMWLLADLYVEPPLEDTLLSAGGYIMIGAWVFGIIEPFYFNVKYNQKLRNALQLDRKEDVSSDQQIAQKDSGYVFETPEPEPRIQLTLVRFQY